MARGPYRADLSVFLNFPATTQQPSIDLIQPSPRILGRKSLASHQAQRMKGLARS